MSPPVCLYQMYEQIGTIALFQQAATGLFLQVVTTQSRSVLFKQTAAFVYQHFGKAYETGWDYF